MRRPRTVGGRRRSWRVSTVASSLAVTAAVLSCSGGEGDPDAAADASGSAPAVETERQRDSVLGQSALPGARGVRRARQLADSAEARYRGLDTIGR